jgi:hypothetical protein
MNSSKVKNGLGWSRRAWFKPLKDFQKDNQNMYEHSLEIGASEHSSLAPFLYEVSNKVSIGYYECDVMGLQKKLIELDCNKELQFADMTNIYGKYDLIVAKSVLGGLFRENESNIEGVNSLISNIISQNLNSGGALLLLDNGKSFFEKMLSKFGARKNKWRYFQSKDFRNPRPFKQYTFGFLTCFSFESRLGLLGRALDNILYLCDIFLSKYTNHPTVILTVYRKQS